MKKMLSLILLWSFVVGANVALTGCGDSDKGGNNNNITNPTLTFTIGDMERANALKGTWRMSTVEYTFSIEGNQGHYTASGINISAAAGSGSTQSESGLFSVNGSQITLRKSASDGSSNYTDRTVSYEISGNSLTIEGYTLTKVEA
jgi:hypothetical protein